MSFWTDNFKYNMSYYMYYNSIYRCSDSDFILTLILQQNEKSTYPFYHIVGHNYNIESWKQHIKLQFFSINRYINL